MAATALEASSRTTSKKSWAKKPLPLGNGRLQCLERPTFNRKVIKVQRPSESPRLPPSSAGSKHNAQLSFLTPISLLRKTPIPSSAKANKSSTSTIYWWAMSSLRTTRIFIQICRECSRRQRRYLNSNGQSKLLSLSLTVSASLSRNGEREINRLAVYCHPNLCRVTETADAQWANYHRLRVNLRTSRASSFRKPRTS